MHLSTNTTNAKGRFVLKSVFNRRNLLLSNAILCFCYSVCYSLLILLPFGDQAVNQQFHTNTVVVLNMMFLLSLVLNLNTISFVYKQLQTPRKYIRIVYRITFSVWLLYVLIACFCTLYYPGFITHFHHYIRHSFSSLGITKGFICFVFGTGLSLLLREYYTQMKMKHILFFVIPATLEFSFKVMLPFLFTIQAWVVYCGCQLLLYYSIVHQRSEKKMAKEITLFGKNNIITEKKACLTENV